MEKSYYAYTISHFVCRFQKNRNTYNNLFQIWTEFEKKCEDKGDYELLSLMDSSNAFERIKVYYCINSRLTNLPPHFLKRFKTIYVADIKRVQTLMSHVETLMNL